MLLSGMGGFPQLPKRKRWYVCNLDINERNDATWLCKETPESKIHWVLDEYANVPEYMPRFLDQYFVRYGLNTHIPVRILEPSKSQETLPPKRQTPSSPPPESPSVRQVPTAAYTGAHKPPKNPFQ